MTLNVKECPMVDNGPNVVPIVQACDNITLEVRIHLLCEFLDRAKPFLVGIVAVKTAN